ncbi:uncharacterized protein LAESUDRAFT_486606 [Laetiporus sulphureus 93-53]|uniref:EXPERA domain-containing protein n=1 Tax=Laetiporus sulphureus 93-53 TaxID=1314785 RepID=A0A165BNA4_9APHY|nr:uncharacterized protein LAESUDRAFT_486606 [Laetiporus sulphureus 93-53]KZT01352.1 hypothetical protein LAESUDRAFT_486606 [Laetiporus sulphureus 93-53]
MSGFDFLDLGNTLLVGFLFALMLYGCSVAQVLYYVWKYPEDRWMLKLLVAVLWSLDTVHTIIDIMIVWHYVVAGHGNLLELEKLYSTAVAEYALAVPIVFLVQCYYIYIIWRRYIHDSDHRVTLKLAAL